MGVGAVYVHLLESTAWPPAAVHDVGVVSVGAPDDGLTRVDDDRVRESRSSEEDGGEAEDESAEHGE